MIITKTCRKCKTNFGLLCEHGTISACPSCGTEYYFVERCPHCNDNFFAGIQLDDKGKGQRDCYLCGKTIVVKKEVK